MTTRVETEPTDSVETVAEPTAKAAAAEGEPVQALSFDDRVDRVRALVTKQPLHREMLYKTLVFCCERRALRDIENEIATYPEFKYGTQDQYHLISFLADAGGLERFELDDAGGVVTEARKAGLTEDEIDDLVVAYAYITTDAGRAVVEQLDPRQRIRGLLDSMPEHAGAFAQILELCTVLRAYTEIERLFGDLDEDDEDLSTIRSVYDRDTPHPSVFVSNLERAGALVWDDGWRCTEEGRAMLDMIRRGSLSSGA